NSVDRLRIVVSLNEASQTPYTSSLIERAGNTQFPEWNATFMASYSRGPLSISWTERWVSALERNLQWETGIDVDDNRIASQRSTNIRVGYDLDVNGSNYSLYAQVNNLMDYDPSRVQGLTNMWGNIGRTYTMGVRMDY